MRSRDTLGDFRDAANRKGDVTIVGLQDRPGKLRGEAGGVGNIVKQLVDDGVARWFPPEIVLVNNLATLGSDLVLPRGEIPGPLRVEPAFKTFARPDDLALRVEQLVDASDAGDRIPRPWGGKPLATVEGLVFEPHRPPAGFQRETIKLELLGHRRGSLLAALAGPERGLHTHCGAVVERDCQWLVEFDLPRGLVFRVRFEGDRSPAGEIGVVISIGSDPPEPAAGIVLERVQWPPDL